MVVLVLIGNWSWNQEVVISGSYWNWKLVIGLGVWSYWSFRLVDQVGIKEQNVFLLLIKPC